MHFDKPLNTVPAAVPSFKARIDCIQQTPRTDLLPQCEPRPSHLRKSLLYSQQQQLLTGAKQQQLLLHKMHFISMHSAAMSSCIVALCRLRQCNAELTVVASAMTEQRSTSCAKCPAVSRHCAKCPGIAARDDTGSAAASTLCPTGHQKQTAPDMTQSNRRNKTTSAMF